MCIESDSKLMVDLLGRSLISHHPLFSLVSQCQNFLKKDWHVQVRHMFHEANCVADRLACLCFSFPLGLHVLSALSEGISFPLFDDVRDRAIPA